MKTKIIPAINAQTFEEVKEKINLLKDLTNHFHLDVASLEFTGYQTYPRIYADLERINTIHGLSGFGTDITDKKYPHQSVLYPYKSVVFDLHLMLSLKPQEILKWAKENIKNLILHLEASQNPDGLLKIAKKTKKKIFIAWSPDVEFDFIKKYLNYVDGVLILGVRPGKAGQKFLEETYSRIEQIKSIHRSCGSNTDNADNIDPYKSALDPYLSVNKKSVLNPHRSVKLMIDGGVNEENFKKILSYEPDYIVMASAIYDSENPKEKYQWFLNQIKN
jgi:ribulose-phosphate 3-epimerase